jgi:hypothetical protein
MARGNRAFNALKAEFKAVSLIQLSLQIMAETDSLGKSTHGF